MSQLPTHLMPHRFFWVVLWVTNLPRLKCRLLILYNVDKQTNAQVISFDSSNIHTWCSQCSSTNRIIFNIIRERLKNIESKSIVSNNIAAMKDAISQDCMLLKLFQIITTYIVLVKKFSKSVKVFMKLLKYKLQRWLTSHFWNHDIHRASREKSLIHHALLNFW